MRSFSPGDKTLQSTPAAYYCVSGKNHLWSHRQVRNVDYRKVFTQTNLFMWCPSVVAGVEVVEFSMRLLSIV